MTASQQGASETAAGDPLNEFSWATAATDNDAKIGLADVLVRLQLMATDAAREKAAENSGWWAKTPPSMQVIRSGTQAVTRWWATAVAAVGGVSGLLAGISGAIGSMRNALGDAVVVALLGAAAVILAATAVSVAMFVRADLESRGQATAARHAARAEVAAAFLHATAALPRRAPGAMSPEQLLGMLTAFPNRVRVSTFRDPKLRLVKGMGVQPGGGVQVELEGRDWVAIEDLDRYTTAAP
ncbi:hypothetical protein [Couchioplanes azureus]|uniref:hypothetical protein n=1 Tax=Couchioplanes caeruleus TaxID=56438 RepID=UPI00166F8D11|nr:hypothetical protein [Couchioplanes caeruleus]GGQ55316.1 hypothetical protein GCM10010166_25600 [Couchioplanes caeruleus subsp. azureus]